MAIQVINKRFTQFVEQSNIPTAKEVVMSKVNAIVVKQSNPKQEVKQMAKQEKTYTESEVKQMIAYALSKGQEDKPLSKKEVYTRTHHHPRPEVIRISAQTAQEVAPIKVKADMHAAGVKAYQTRIFKQQYKVFEKVAKDGEVGKVFSVLIDEGLPTEKTLRAKYDSRSGRLHSFRVKVEKRLGKADYSYYYLPIAIQL